MLRKILTLLALGATLALGACAGVPGPLNGLSKDPAHMAGFVKNPLYGPMTASDYKLGVQLVNYCNDRRKEQLSGFTESVATGVGLYGVTGLLAAPTAMSGFVGGTKGAVREIGLLNAVNGGDYGAIAYSGAVTGFVGSCAGDLIKDGKAQELAPGMHIFASGIRTRNTSDKVPDWASDPKTIPEWALSRSSPKK